MIPGTIPWPATGKIKSDIQLFNSSGTFTVPAGVTNIFVTVIGGGGSGGINTQCYVGGTDQGYSYFSGGAGGRGGLAMGYIPTTPGESFTVTVGAGGQGGANQAGGSSTIYNASYNATATGGGAGTNSYCGGNGTNGANGSGSGTPTPLYTSNVDNQSTMDTYLNSEIITPWYGTNSYADVSALIADSITINVYTNYVPVTWTTTYPTAFVPGAGGGVDGFGGVSGLVLVAWGGDI